MYERCALLLLYDAASAFVGGAMPSAVLISADVNVYDLFRPTNTRFFTTISAFTTRQQVDPEGLQRNH